MNLSRIKKAYLIGIKGVMMTAIAQYLKEQGIKVSGSDTHEKFFTDGVLKAHKIPFKEKFDKKNVPVDADLVIYSLAYDNKNVEVKEAMDKGLKVMDHGRFLADIVGKRVDEIFLLPREAVHEDQTVYVVEEERIRVKPVDVFRRRGNQVYIRKGLAERDLVVTRFPGVATDGMKVRIKPASGNKGESG